MKCPRRIEVPFAETKYPQDDEWRPGHKYSTCNFCGSLHPDMLLELIRTGSCELGPTDKNYKVYVMTIDGDYKFYFMHLSEEQMNEFIDLLNTKRVKIGYPGGFYVLPYFIQRG